jgi:hypothetical protein
VLQIPAAVTSYVYDILQVVVRLQVTHIFPDQTTRVATGAVAAVVNVCRLVVVVTLLKEPPHPTHTIPFVVKEEIGVVKL